MAEEFKFPTEVIDLPSEGKLYPPDSPLTSGKIEVKYMTAKEEDILTSQNLIKKGVVIERLLDSLIVTDGVKSEDLLLGDKNAVLVAARILAYGPDYVTEITDPTSGDNMQHKFNLADCPFKKIPEDVDTGSGNEFEILLPVSKLKVKFKVLTGKDENAIALETKKLEKLNPAGANITTRLRYAIVSVDGKDDRGFVNSFVENMLSKDSFSLREEIARVSPDIDMKQDIELGGELVTVDIPMTVDFFWPKTRA